LEGPRQRKMDTRFGTWNVRSLCRTGSMKTVAVLPVIITVIKSMRIRWMRHVAHM